MLKFTELVTSKALAAYWNVKKNERAPYFGEAKFPAKKKLGLDLSYIKGARKAPVMLSLSAFNANTLTLERGTIEKLNTNMPFFKNDKVIDEEDRQELNKLVGSSNDAAVKLIITEIYNDKLTLVEDALMTLEVMRMQALTTGALSIASNGQAYSYDYQVPNNHKVQPATKWDVDGADPVADIDAWLNMIEDETGKRPEEAVMNSATATKLTKVAAIRKGVYPTSDGTVGITRDQAIRYLEENTDLKISINSKSYTNAAGQKVKFVADGVIVFMPSGPVGNTWFGTTPEESDLMASHATKAQVSIVETGIAITTAVQDDPVTVKTKVSMIALPSFDLADLVVIANVLTPTV